MYFEYLHMNPYKFYLRNSAMKLNSNWVDSLTTKIIHEQFLTQIIAGLIENYRILLTHSHLDEI